MHADRKTPVWSTCIRPDTHLPGAWFPVLLILSSLVAYGAFVWAMW